MIFTPLDESNYLQIPAWLKSDKTGRRYLSDYLNGFQDILHLLGTHRKAWIISMNNNPIGFVDFEIKSNKGYFSFYVAPNYRNKGYSKPILEQLANMARNMSINKLIGCVEVDNQISKKSLVNSGFTEEGLDKDGLVIYSKSI